MVKSYTDKQLHTQMLYLKSLFDVEWSKAKVEADNKRRADKITPSPLTPEEKAVFDALAEQADVALRRSAFHTVDLGALFSSVATPEARSMAVE